MAVPVSLAVPVYNGQAYLAQTLDSLLAQTFPDFEIIITDNASTDATQEICQSYASRDRRIRYVRNDANLGAAGNFNRGFALSKGEFFKWCAHDDLLSPDFLERCVRALRDDPTAIIAHGRQQLIDAEGRTLSGTTGDLLDISDATDPAERFGLVFRTQGFDAAMFGLFRSSMLARTSLHRPYYSSDIALLAECALLGRFTATEAVFYNREHAVRSVNIQDKIQRHIWHTGTRPTRPKCEHLWLLAHFLEMATRPPHGVPRRRILPQVLAWAARPRQLARYGLELLALASPRCAGSLKTTGKRVLLGLHRSREPDRRMARPRP
ncbi:MAG: glycosyltransferase family 2 protein [Hyphomicrobiaceae bacterium]